MIITIIVGNVPVPKKNSKKVAKNRYTGKVIVLSSDKYQVWHKMTYFEISQQVKNYKYLFPLKMIKELVVEYTFGDKRKRDLSNLNESVQDLLVDMQILDDDNMEVLSKITMIYKGYEKDKPKTKIILNI